MTNSIPASEFVEARALLPLLHVPETDWLGHLRLLADGHHRYWYAVNGTVIFQIKGGPTTDEYSVSVPPGAVYATSIIDDDAQAIEVVSDDNGTSFVGRHGTVRFGLVADKDGLNTTAFGRQPDIIATATLRAPALRELAYLMAICRLDENEEEAPETWIAIDEGFIEIVSTHSSIGEKAARCFCSTTGSVAVPISPRFLIEILDVFKTDEVTISVPRYNEDPIEISRPGRRALMKPQWTPNRHLRRHVEAVITEAYGQLSANLDESGAYPLVRYGHDITATLDFDSEPEMLGIHAVLLDGIEATPLLLSELNDLNARRTLVRIFHRDGKILAESDHPAHTLDAHELRSSVEHIMRISKDVVPMLSAVLGGQTLPDPAAERRSRYRGTIIEANLLPTESVLLSGDGATDEWPFPGPVWVLTGWNPQGVSRDQDSGRKVNLQIARDIIERGGQFVQGAGWSITRDHMEPSLVAWDLDRETALDMGRRAQQDAIFELDADEVHLLGCFDDEIETWPRRS